MQNNFVAMIIVVLYMVILLAISWYSTKYLQKKDSASFLFAKKAMSWPLVAMIVSGCAIGGDPPRWGAGQGEPPRQFPTRGANGRGLPPGF